MCGCYTAALTAKFLASVTASRLKVVLYVISCTQLYRRYTRPIRSRRSRLMYLAAQDTQHDRQHSTTDTHGT